MWYRHSGNGGKRAHRGKASRAGDFRATSHRGFGIVELMVVVSFIGMVAVLAMQAYAAETRANTLAERPPVSVKPAAKPK